MPESLIIFLAALVICIAIVGVDLFKPYQTSAPPGIGRRSTSGFFTTVAFFGIISGWALPHMITEYGLPAGYGALMIIAVTIVITLLSRRLWVLAQRYETRSQITLVRLYYRDDGLAGIVSVMNGIMCVVLVAMIFHLIGSVASHVSGYGIYGFYMGVVGIALGGYMISMARSQNHVTRSDVISFIVYVIGVIGLGIIVLDKIGGFEGLGIAIEQHVLSAGRLPATEGFGGGDFPAFLALPGMYQNVFNVPGDFLVGSPWTGLMILSASLCLVGVGVSQIGFVQISESPDTRRFIRDHVGRYAFTGGGLAVVFSIIAGLGTVVGVDLNILKVIAGESSMSLDVFTRTGFALFGFVIATTGLAMLFNAFSMPVETSSNHRQPSKGKINILIFFAGVLAFTPLVQLVDYVTLMMALSAQLLPLVFGLCWLPWLTRSGVLAGLIAGIIAVLLTDFPGVLIQQALIENLVWGISPLTMHAAGWGLIINILVAIVVSTATQTDDGRDHRAIFHDVLQKHAPIHDEARGLIPVAWIFTASWFLFALGPGAVIGNSIFGAPDQPAESWNFQIPSIWAWQIFMWVMGVALVWFLAMRLGISHPVEGVVKPVIKHPDNEQ